MNKKKKTKKTKQKKLSLSKGVATPAKNPRLAVIYARYSSDRQTEQSIEGQVRACTEYAERNGFSIVETYVDRAKSGRTDNRPAFQRMLADSATNEWSTVLVYKLDRFSRSKYEMAMHRKVLRDNGVKLLSVTEGIPDSPEGVLLESLLEGMAEYYSLELKQKTERGQRESRLKGNYCGGAVPYGYEIVQKKYVIKEAEACIVRRIFSEYVMGRRIVDIIGDLNALGLRLRNGNLFNRRAINRILCNECYVGIYRHPTDGAFFDTIPPIVSESLFDLARQTAEENAHSGTSCEVVYLLKNRIRCGHCGHKLVANSKPMRDGTFKRFYTCNGKKRHRVCKKECVPKEDIEKFVVEVTLKLLNTPENLDTLAKRIAEASRTQKADISAHKQLVAEQERLRQVIDRLSKTIESGVTSQSIMERLKRHEEQLAAVMAGLEKERVKRIGISEEDVKKYFIEAVREEPLAMIRLLVEKVVVYDDKVEIYYRFTSDKRPDDEHQVFFVCAKEFTFTDGVWWDPHGRRQKGLTVELFVSG